MPQEILQSVVNLTDQRSIESLEHSLPGSIAALLPVHSISIYKPLLDQDYQEVEEILKFLVQDSYPTQLWSAEPAILGANQLLQNCFRFNTVQEQEKADGKSEIYYPVVIDNQTISAIRIESSPLDDSQRLVLDSLSQVYKNCLTVLTESGRDKLTSLLNRRTFDQRFSKLVALQENQQGALWERYEKPEKRQLNTTDKVYVAMIDIDHFKQVNDKFGHVYGDEVLLLMANLMRESFRNSDLLFRFGGEEFVILLEPTSTENAFQILERFRKKVLAYTFPQIGNLTISTGYTAVSESSLASQVYCNVDQALYYAKKNGRNATVCFEELVQDGKIMPSENIGSIEYF